MKDFSQETPTKVKKNANVSMKLKPVLYSTITLYQTSRKDIFFCIWQ